MYKIAVIPGDGTGPEVTAEAVKVLKVAADKFVKDNQVFFQAPQSGHKVDIVSLAWICDF